METRVIKLGGSVLRGSQYFKSIIKLIKSYDTPIVIVVSAFYGQTNTLLNLLNSKPAKTICKRVKGDTTAGIRGIQNISLIAAIGEGIIRHTEIAVEDQFRLHRM